MSIWNLVVRILPTHISCMILKRLDWTELLAFESVEYYGRSTIKFVCYQHLNTRTNKVVIINSRSYVDLKYKHWNLKQILLERFKLYRFVWIGLCILFYLFEYEAYTSSITCYVGATDRLLSLSLSLSLSLYIFLIRNGMCSNRH